MQTINIEIARNKIKILSEFLDGLGVLSSADGMASYFAAREVRNAGLRVGTERKCAAAKKAVKAFNVMVSIANNPRGLPAVRLYSPLKQVEIFL